MTQTYTDLLARERMANGLCPECGQTPDNHTGWGVDTCLLTDNGVVQRIAQYKKETDHTFRNGKEFVGGGWPKYDKMKKELLAKEEKKG